MRLLPLLFVLLSIQGFSQKRKFYFSSVSGNDSYNATQAQSPTTPWKTLAKLKVFMSTGVADAGGTIIKPIGTDSVLLKAGEEFRGKLSVAVSGGDGGHIVITSYPKGAGQAIISGMQKLTGWTQSGNIWTSTDVLNPVGTPNMLTLNGELQQISRFPNESTTGPGFGYIRATSITRATDVTFKLTNWNTVTGHPGNSSSNFAGAKILARMNRFMTALKAIKSSTFSTDGTTATFVTDDNKGGEINGSERGFFFTNSTAFMDQDWEWSYDVTNKKFSVYLSAGVSPVGKNIEVPVIDKVVDLGSSNYITLDNLYVTGGSSNGIECGNGSNNDVKNCTIYMVGQWGLSNTCDNSVVSGNTIDMIGRYGISSKTGTNILFTDNTISRINTMMGVGEGGTRAGCGIDMGGDSKKFVYNHVRNFSYAVANVNTGKDQLIAYNVVDSPTMRIDDGGSFYTIENTSSNTYQSGYETGRIFKNNIIRNFVGFPMRGTFETTNQINTLYLDEYTHHVLYDSNIVIGGTGSGTALLANDPTNDTVTHNIFYNMSSAIFKIQAKHTDVPIVGNVFKNNVYFYTNTVNQAEFTKNTGSPDINNFGTFDNNYFVAPYDRNGQFFQDAGGTYTLSGWQTAHDKHELHSKLSPNPTAFSASTQPVGNYTKLIYNDHKRDSTIHLGTKVWWTAQGDSLKGDVVLKPFSGYALVYKRDLGTNTDVTGPTVALTSPANNATFTAGDDITLTATANDASGIDRVEFYYGSTLIGTATGSSPYSVVWNNVPATSYALTAVAYDNAGNSTKTSVTSITVNTAPKPPVINITNPATNSTFSISDTITINASASSPNTGGTITKVEFFQNNISLGFDISTPYTLQWKNPAVGTYTIKAVATDNLGQIGTSTSVTVTVVSSIANKAPTVTLGAVSSLYVVGSTINLTATAADADGTVKKVEFYSNTGILIGSDTTNPYSFAWKPTSGTYSVTAKATDNSGGSTMTSGTAVIVDAPPTVTLTSPVAGVVYPYPATVQLSATTTDSDGTVDSVEFYDGNILIWTERTTPWDRTYTTLSVGSHTLTAVAYDNNKIKDTSAAIPITVGAATPNGITGELKKWHKITITFDGPSASEGGTPNPFMDYRMNVAFTHSSGKTYTVPGYFAADGAASETGATTGTKWRVHFTPDLTGTWTYKVSFRSGTNIAISDVSTDGTAVSSIDGQTGTFNVAATDKTGIDLRSKGRLQYTGNSLLQWAETGEYFRKVGTDAPENLLAYDDFDNTSDYKTYRKSYSPHLQDWKTGDPTWQSTKGKGLIGAINYLSGAGVNSISFLTMNIRGDDRNVWPYTDTTNRTRFDVSKLDQWGIVFDHGEKMGMHLHFKTQEVESWPTLGGTMTDQRKVYYRELIARFGYHLAMNWNLGEENTQTTSQQQAMAQYFYDHDPYHNNIVLHSYPSEQDLRYTPLLGTASKLTGVSIQKDEASVYSETRKWVENSANAGTKWIVANDEQGPADVGVAADAAYTGNRGTVADNSETIRKDVLWGNLMAGGAGVEYYYGYNTGETDLTLQDFRSRAKSFGYEKIAKDFFSTYFPTTVFTPVSNVSTGWSMTKADNSAYIVYLKAGGSTSITLPSNSYTLQWFNPKAGGALTTANTITSTGAALSITAPNTSNDWVGVLLKTTINNLPPSVNITSPINGSSYTVGDVVTISATAADQDGTVSQVEIFNGTTRLSTLTSAPYTYSWSGMVVGPYTIIVKATDNSGSSTSTSVSITVAEKVIPPAGPGDDKYYIKNKKFYKK